MAYVTPGHVASGQTTGVSTALQTYETDLTFLLNPPRVQCTNSTGIVLPTSGTYTLLTWDTETFDTDGMHSTSSNTSRLTATTAGYYKVTFIVAFPANTTGQRTLMLRKNAAGSSGGGTLILPYIMGSGIAQTWTFQWNGTIPLAAGDYLEGFAVQFSGATMTLPANSYSMFEAVWCGQYP